MTVEGHTGGGGGGGAAVGGAAQAVGQLLGTVITESVKASEGEANRVLALEQVRTDQEMTLGKHRELVALQMVAAAGGNPPPGAPVQNAQQGQQPQGQQQGQGGQTVGNTNPNPPTSYA